MKHVLVLCIMLAIDNARIHIITIVYMFTSFKVTTIIAYSIRVRTRLYKLGVSGIK